jgi:hypothetical protein
LTLNRIGSVYVGAHSFALLPENCVSIKTFLAVVVLLAPFLAKPFNMDDPLFIWAARQIQAHPLNPYGFPVGVSQVYGSRYS